MSEQAALAGMLRPPLCSRDSVSISSGGAAGRSLRDWASAAGVELDGSGSLAAAPARQAIRAVPAAALPCSARHRYLPPLGAARARRGLCRCAYAQQVAHCGCRNAAVKRRKNTATRRAATHAGMASGSTPALLDREVHRRLLPAPRSSDREAAQVGDGEVNIVDGFASVTPQTSTATPLATASDWTRALLPFLFPALGGLLFGYDIGATSGALISLKDPTLSGTDWYNLSSLATGLVVSGSLIGALVGSALAFVVADVLGRRRELMVAAVLYAVGAVVTSTAPSLPLLICGRVLFGLGIGLAMHAAPMYIAETAPASTRGTLIALKEGFIVGGILLGYLGGSAFIGDEGGWREMFAAGIPVALLMLAGMWSLPPSPRWLLLRSAEVSMAEAEVAALRAQAMASLQRLRGPGAAAAAEVAAILKGVEEEQRLTRVRRWQEGGEAAGAEGVSELFRGANGAALLIASGLVAFQQITGQPSVLYYAASILQDAGFSAAQDATEVSVVLGVFKLAMTGVAVALVDKLGRRPLLLAGVGGLVVSLASLATVYTWDGLSPMLSAAALLLFVGSYQVSFGPITWLMVSEVFALNVRGRAQALTTLLNFGSNALVTFTLPPVQEAIGQANTFYSFAAIGVAALAFIYWKVPETKGLTLEEIEAKLTSTQD